MSVRLLVAGILVAFSGTAGGDVSETLSKYVVRHGGKSPQVGLDRTSREAALHGGRSGMVLEPGKSESSLAYTMVCSAD